jgi:hypothetical protein
MRQAAYADGLLFEHRASPHRRSVVLHFLSEAEA